MGLACMLALRNSPLLATYSTCRVRHSGHPGSFDAPKQRPHDSPLAVSNIAEVKRMAVPRLKN